jgi:glutamyl-tRNA synthetase
MPRTRLAPSPTGALHLGNARTFLVNWAMARQQGWDVVLRIEDLDGPRVKREASAEAIDILQWLGLDWDQGPLYQRRDLTPYEAALQQLVEQGDVYLCRCTRREIEAASLSAPHGDEHELRYPGTCRPEGPAPFAREPPSAQNAAWRLRVPEKMTSFIDNFAGRHEHNIQAASGDFLVATKEGLPSYQLAVVVDDARQQVDRIVRGDDLLASTHRQLLLQQRLALAPMPEYWHLPLVVGADCRRLAKRHGDSRISHYRSRGAPPERLIGLLAEWSGLGPRREMSLGEFLDRFDINLLPKTPIVFTPTDDVWLSRNGVRKP